MADRLRKNHLEKFTACYATGLAREPSLAGRMILDLEQPPEQRAWGFGDQQVEDCIDAVVSTMAIASEGGELSCELILGKPAPLRATVRTDSALVDVGDDVKVDGTPVLDGALLATGPEQGFPPLRIALTPLVKRARGQVIIRAKTGVSAKSLLAVSTSAALAGFRVVIWTVGETTEVLPGSLRYRYAQGHADAPISLYVQATDTLLISSAGPQSFPLAAGNELEARLVEWRTVSGGGRDDLEISSQDDITFDRIANLMRIAARAGYTSIAFIRASSLSHGLPTGVPH